MVNCLTTQSKPAATSMGAAEASTYKKNHPELGKCMTAAQAAWLDSLDIGIQDLVQLRDYNSQKGFLTALREKGVTSRDYSHTLRKPPLASTDVAH